jgi:hypothetical protein
MSQRLHLDPLSSPEALDNLAASYRTIAGIMETEATQHRMLKMAEKFEGLARLRRSELEDRRKGWEAW